MCVLDSITIFVLNDEISNTCTCFMTHDPNKPHGCLSDLGEERRGGEGEGCLGIATSPSPSQHHVLSVERMTMMQAERSPVHLLGNSGIRPRPRPLLELSSACKSFSRLLRVKDKWALRHRAEKRSHKIKNFLQCSCVISVSHLNM